jgi:ABC-type sugar transport system ATPase subunit
MIFISHALQDVKAVADEIAVLRDGEVITQEPAEDLPIGRMVALMVGRQLEAMYPQRNNVPKDDVALEVSGITQPKIVKNINFKVRKGEIVGIFGLMGAGRSELLRILFGLDPKQSGVMKIHDVTFDHITPGKAISHGMAFVTENRREDGLLMDLSVLNNVALVQLRSFARVGFLNLVALTKEMLAVLKATSVKVSDPVSQPIRSLSGGNQQKVIIGKWMAGSPGLFILDEPTRGVDVGAKFEIYTKIQGLAQNGTSVLVASSEIEELIGICDRILVMSRGEITGEFALEAFDRHAILHAAFGGKE